MKNSQGTFFGICLLNLTCHMIANDILEHLLLLVGKILNPTHDYFWKKTFS